MKSKFEEWMSTIGINALRHANCCKIAYEAGQQSRQAEVDEQQKRIDELEHEKSLQELEINQISQANQEWQRINVEQQKRIDAVNLIQLQAAEAEVLRLQGGFDELRKWCDFKYGKYEYGYDIALCEFEEEIDRITGASQ